MRILGIETSCDETAAAIVQDGTKLICSSLASSKDILLQYGGIVPEIAARKQEEFFVPTLDKLMNQYISIENFSDFKSAVNSIDSIAVTVGPGLIGSLLVGVEGAKSLSLAWNKPLIPVNHLVGHIYGNFVNNPSIDKITFPCIVLIVSGGHTDLVLMKSHGDLTYLGGTLDDAAGEAFDKVARLLGIADYLGGAKLSEIATTSNKKSFAGKLPRPKINDPDYDFSFSGLKTAVRRITETQDFIIEDLAHEFEEAVVDILVTKTLKAANNFDVKTILLGGGVSANKTLRTKLADVVTGVDINLFVPPIDLCTDNAIYIASAAYFNNRSLALPEIRANPSLSITD